MLRLTLLSIIAVAPSGYANADPLDKAFDHLFNFEFSMVDSATADLLHNPLAHCLRAAALLFSEFSNLKIWEGEDFFGNGHRSKAKPDEAVRRRFQTALQETRRLADAAIAQNARDTLALFSYMLSYGLETDYIAYIERRSMASFDACKKGQLWADKLLAVDPHFDDAYFITGLNEYMLGALPAVVRWAVKVETAKGDKQNGLQHLETAARGGRYFPAFAKLLLAVFYEREKQVPKAVAMLEDLSVHYPKNPLFRNQLARLREMQRW